MASLQSDQKVFFIGYNSFGEFGFGHDQPLRNFKQCEYPITRIYAGNTYSIYSDDNYENIWSAGYNAYGQCGIGEQGKSTLFEFNEITYFKDNNIKIKKICVSPIGGSSFFITTNGNVYGCGDNDTNQLGLTSGILDQDEEYDEENKSEPTLISQLSDVIDIQNSIRFSIALCSSDNNTLLKIINNWCRLYTVPDDILSLLILFSKFSKVYSTVFSGHGHGDKYANAAYLGIYISFEL